jgi:3-dehydroquinate synthase
VVVVSDGNIAPYYAERVSNSIRKAGLPVRVQLIPAGEEFKTLETVAGLWRVFLEAGLDRKSTVVALGGGVVSDLAGFAASTFMRGCPWVVVPTTLLSMVDASLGGKTGFDLPEGKNLVGAFHPPRLVLSDPQVLATLPDAEMRSGLAEVIKHGIISDPELFAMCAQGYEAIMDDLPRIVRRAIAVKALVIEKDPFEKGIRAALNLGHTIGHAVEIVSGFTLRHGESVAIGMVVEARLAEYLSLAASGLAEKISTVLAEIGLPVAIPANMSVDSLIAHMKFDKKKSNNIVRFALPINIGAVDPSVPVADLEGILSAEFLYSLGSEMKKQSE